MYSQHNMDQKSIDTHYMNENNIDVNIDVNIDINDENNDTNIVDTTLEPSESIDVIEKFLQIYNTKTGHIGSIFDKINVKDPTDTNEPMEMFYEYMLEHASLFEENQEYVDVYVPDIFEELNKEHEVYALVIGKEAHVKYLSYSYISLLTIGVRSPSDVGRDWSIVMM